MFEGIRFWITGIRRVKVVEQLIPGGMPCRAVYEFDAQGRYLRGGLQALSKSEEGFYSRPVVNEAAVRHKWLDNPARLDLYAKGLEGSLPSEGRENPQAEIEESSMEATIRRGVEGI